MIPIKSSKEIEKMRQSCRTASEILERVSELVRLDLCDVHPGLGPSGKLHVRFGKAANTSGPRQTAKFPITVSCIGVVGLFRSAL